MVEISSKISIIEQIQLPWQKEMQTVSALLDLAVTDPHHPTGGRRRRKLPPVELPELPTLHTLASDQPESFASEESDVKKPRTPKSSATTPRSKCVFDDDMLLPEQYETGWTSVLGCPR